MTAPADPFDLQRFVQAQQGVYATARAEVAAGSKRSHWMWFIFPQLKGLGMSSMAQHYGLASLDEARAYLGHPLLGERLRECCRSLLAVQGKSASAIFGAPDDMKLRSCLTLFSHAAPQEDLFRDCLARFFAGNEDPATLALLK